MSRGSLTFWHTAFQAQGLGFKSGLFYFILWLLFAFSVKENLYTQLQFKIMSEFRKQHCVETTAEAPRIVNGDHSSGSSFPLLKIKNKINN